MSNLLRRSARFAIALSLAGLCGGLVKSAAASDLALGANGEVYRLRTGAYGQLFPGGTDASPDANVLALDIARPDLPLQRLLVPATAGEEQEDSATLVFEDASQSVFVLWESRPSPIHPILEIASYDGTNWSDVIQILGNYYARKSSPQMVITHDVLQATSADGTATTIRRTILHTLWAEDNAAGTQDTFYTPIILDNGRYLGSSPLFRLNGLDPSPTVATAPDVADNLLVAPHLQAGRDDRSVIAAFADAVSRRIATIEITVLPRELSSLADDARAHIIGVGATAFPGNLSALAADARAHIIGVGVTFQPEVVQAMANDVASMIVAADPSAGLVSIADQARAHIIGIGARMSAGGLRSITDLSFSNAQQIAEIDGGDPTSSDGMTHLLRFSVAASRPAPRLGAGNVEMYLSPDGQKVVLSWESDTAVGYREQSAGGPWSDVRQLILGDTLDLNAARLALAQRALNR